MLTVYLKESLGKRAWCLEESVRDLQPNFFLGQDKNVFILAEILTSAVRAIQKVWIMLHTGKRNVFCSEWDP